MNIKVTENMTVQITTPDRTGAVQHLATLSCSTRPGEHVNVSVDLASAYDPQTLGEQLSNELRAFMDEVWARCKRADLPVPAAADQ